MLEKCNHVCSSCTCVDVFSDFFSILVLVMNFSLLKIYIFPVPFTLIVSMNYVSEPCLVIFLVKVRAVVVCEPLTTETKEFTISLIDRNDSNEFLFSHT